MRKAVIVIMALALAGCVMARREITGESPTGEKYRYKATVTAFGGGSADKVTQALRGELKVYYEDGTPKVSVSLDSTQEGSGLSSNPDALLAGIEFLGRLPIP